MRNCVQFPMELVGVTLEGGGKGVVVGAFAACDERDHNHAIDTHS